MITVETGLLVAGANSYVTVQELYNYCASRGVEVAEADLKMSQLLIRAKDYIESFSEKFKGSPVSESQSLCWPRTEVFVGGSELALSSTQIPQRIKDAQCATAAAMFSGFDPLASFSASNFVLKETVGPISTEYANPISVGIKPNLPTVDALLKPLLIGSGAALRTVRL